MEGNTAPPVRRSRPWRTRIALGVAVLLVLIQFVPYGRRHTNPPVGAEPAWDSPRTRDLAVRTCFDCHSNQTTWPWYSHVAPVSWLVQNHVDEGRRKLNFSEFSRPQKHAHDAVKEFTEGDMPVFGYTLLHGAARLDEGERADLIRGLRATLGAGKPEGHAAHEHGEDDDD